MTGLGQSYEFPPWDWCSVGARTFCQSWAISGATAYAEGLFCQFHLTGEGCMSLFWRSRNFASLRRDLGQNTIHIPIKGQLAPDERTSVSI